MVEEKWRVLPIVNDEILLLAQAPRAIKHKGSRHGVPLWEVLFEHRRPSEFGCVSLRGGVSHVLLRDAHGGAHLLLQAQEHALEVDGWRGFAHFAFPFRCRWLVGMGSCDGLLT